MLKIDLEHRVKKFLRGLSPKQERQILGKIVLLAEGPYPPDSQMLKGFHGMRRADIGEYRIVYAVDTFLPGPANILTTS